MAKQKTKQNSHKKLLNSLVLKDFITYSLGIKSYESLINNMKSAEENNSLYNALFDDQYLRAFLYSSSANKSQIEMINEQIKFICKRINFTPRYYQYIALFYFSAFMIYKNQNKDMNSQIQKYFKSEKNTKYTHLNNIDFMKEDFNKIAFWMATAAGKTHIIHYCIELLNFNTTNYDNVILITPSEELSKSHAKKLKDLNYSVFLYPEDGNINNYYSGDILITDIHKLKKDVKGAGKSLDINLFLESKNLVIVDEAHKGKAGVENVWKDIQESIAGINANDESHKGMLLEFSATLGQVSTDENTREEYSKAIIFDYTYDNFYYDMYGKDFWCYNKEKSELQLSKYPDKELVLTASLLTYYYQVVEYDRIKFDPSKSFIEKPLWIILGSSVINKKPTTESDKKYISEIIATIKYINDITSKPSYLEKRLEELLEYININENNKHFIPSLSLGLFENSNLKDLSKNILKTIFYVQGHTSVVMNVIHNGNNELALGIQQGDVIRYFALIYIGDATTLKKYFIDEPAIEFTIGEDKFSPSLFYNLDAKNSDTNILIGSRRFAEGWDNYRPASLTLLNLGSSEGSLIIQMFGRMVRFKGKNLDGKREQLPKNDYGNFLQTSYIYGLNGKYINDFLKNLSANTSGGLNSEIICETRVSISHDNKLIMPFVQEISKDDFTLNLLNDNWINQVNKIKKNISSVSTLIYSSDKLYDDMKLKSEENITYYCKELFLKIIDEDEIMNKIRKYFHTNNMYNIKYDKKVILTAIKSNKYEIYGQKIGINTIADIYEINDLMADIVIKMVQSAYRKEKNKNMNYIVDNPINSIDKIYTKRRYNESI